MIGTREFTQYRGIESVISIPTKAHVFQCNESELNEWGPFWQARVMFRLFAILSALVGLVSYEFRPPEIWAKPIPFFQVEHQFLAPVSLYGPGHRGLDFVLEAEQRVLAPTSGLVTFSGPVVDRNIITIISSGGYLLSFEQICSSLRPGDFVERGLTLGKFCSINKAFESHCESCIHFSVRGNRGYLNPELFLGSLLPSVLKA
ncbi:MAG: hypothetical protein ACI9SV_000170 [Aquiluna sp.]